MNVVRNAVRPALRCRAYATYVPPASLRDVLPGKSGSKKTPPESPNFYTGSAEYYDQLNGLENAVHDTRTALKTLQLLPLPAFARSAIPPAQPVWQTKRDIAGRMTTPLTMTRYRRLIQLLNQLDQYRRIAEVAGVDVLSSKVGDVLSVFEKANKEAILAHGRRKPVEFDEYGRTYTLGRRKTSTARVWTIAVQRPPEVSEEVDANEEPLPQIESTVTSAIDNTPPKPVQVTTTNVIINNRPLVDYFPQLPDRERVILPFKIAGLVGAYNVFAIVRGGGSTGQSGAVSLGIAKALAAHPPTSSRSYAEVPKLLRRDPRMVERKKTNRRGARAAYNWIKR
ncbi:ribosomal protein S5 domain 2-like protein [Fomitopsis serialis]|uniref:ribosomal protein S5 domain 2-like protein n=1 Tax=Fomitopsis serialis TaxID=139415 RepID=UPI002008AA71|nr:ribosomal protein S5 domain 2-like protein [Neoantrodia serialis]KAH9935536.1 ribosomal protein S5 domain 2-like protein [Neoantrodia serialis]